MTVFQKQYFFLSASIKARSRSISASHLFLNASQQKYFGITTHCFEKMSKSKNKVKVKYKISVMTKAINPLSCLHNIYIQSLNE